MTVDLRCGGLRAAVPQAIYAWGLAGPSSTGARRKTLQALRVVHVHGVVPRSRYREDNMERRETKLPGRDKIFTTFTPPLDGSSATRPLKLVPPGDQTTPMGKLDLILQEIRESRAAMETQLGTLAADISIIRDEHHKLTDRVHTTEKTLVTIEPSLDEQVSIMVQLHKQVELLQTERKMLKVVRVSGGLSEAVLQTALSLHQVRA
ncbi:hypothetical protein NDU88_006141 [Pleurodeles waltl]|uniref:Uncharacterized protein n=1 Tax=Pleurodeles waltl TaxID=8319 RepID=A0AAV7VNC6_PLEWA|nr:hypothetical protein NDU88_006141 [Pleurodeles waltl]